MTNEQRIADLERIIQQAQSQRDTLKAENEQEQETDIQRWERELGMTSEKAQLAKKGKEGAGF